MKLSRSVACTLGSWIALGVGSSVMASTVLEAMPDNRTLKSGQVVYVRNDGRCENGMVLKVTGGSKDKGIKRRIECVRPPK